MKITVTSSGKGGKQNNSTFIDEYPSLIGYGSTPQIAILDLKVNIHTLISKLYSINYDEFSYEEYTHKITEIKQ